MNEPIKAGDLVAVVRAAPCGCNHAVGRIFEVKAVSYNTNRHCMHCGAMNRGVHAAMQPNWKWISFGRLQKINGPRTGQSIERPEEIAA